MAGPAVKHVGAVLLAFAASACGDDGVAALDEGSSTVGSVVDSSTDEASTSAVDDSSSSSADADPFVPDAALAESLPLEILGVCPDGVDCAELAVAIELDALPESGESLDVRLLVHNIVQPGSATLTLNAGAPVELSSAGTGLLRAHGGVAAGTARLDAGDLQPGTNWLRFRYTRQVPDVSGFRVLDVAVEHAGVELGRVDLPWSEPTEWAPPSDAAVDIEGGRAYFTEISRDGGPVCAACHARDGADLQYFAFSNHGIVERARHHLFTLDESEQIASYLRTLPTPVRGRVYDPPLQPGPGNAFAGGVGHASVVDDEAFGEAVFGPGGWQALPDDVAWSWFETSGLDLFHVPAPVQLPAWFQWLPRAINPRWFEIPMGSDGETLRDAELALVEDGSVASAQRFMALAVALGNRILAGSDPELSTPSDHAQRVELMRFAAVRLWEWSRAQDEFADPLRGFPEGTPPYPYELGFAFFEAAQADALATDAWRQTLEWWWMQLVLDAGRGSSNGLRPLDYEDVLEVAHTVGLGPNALVFLHLLGSWEESRGSMAQAWGTALGPARLLSTPMYVLDGDGIAMLMRRFLRREAQWLADGGTLEAAHHDALTSAWTTHCAAMTSEQRTELRAIVDDAAVRADLAACPP